MLTQAIADIKAAGQKAVDTAKGDVTKATGAVATFGTEVETIIGTEATTLVSAFQGMEQRASSWEKRHMRYLNISLLIMTALAAGLLYLRLRG